MRRRFIADEVRDDRAALLGAHAAHLARVLRARLGQEFDIAAEGKLRRGRIISLAEDRVDFELLEEIAAAPAAQVTLLLAVFKFDRMEWALEKCTELGVSRVVPLITTRTGAHLTAASQKRVDRWRRLVLQASEQSRRLAPPEVTAPRRLNRDALQLQGVRIVLSEAEQQLTLGEALASEIPDSTAAPAINLAVGPEGGWTSPELKLFADSGWTSASLGETILRAETAAIAALAVIRMR